MSVSHVSGEFWRGVGEVVESVEHATGLSLGWMIAIGVAVALFGVFFGGSGKGRGRRYRRGFRVGYLEELGKQRAKMRAEHERAERERKGWDMDTPHKH